MLPVFRTGTMAGWLPCNSFSSSLFLLSLPDPTAGCVALVPALDDEDCGGRAPSASKSVLSAAASSTEVRGFLEEMVDVAGRVLTVPSFSQRDFSISLSFSPFGSFCRRNWDFSSRTTGDVSENEDEWELLLLLLLLVALFSTSISPLDVLSCETEVMDRFRQGNYIKINYQL